MPGFCCACGLEIGDGAEVAYRADLPPEAARVHKACEASPLRPAYAGRLATVVSLPPAAARRVASGMGLTVTRNKRYMPHLEVCFRAADAAVARATPDARWAALVAGGAVPGATAAPAGAAKPGSGAPEALVDAVAAAVEEALVDLDSRVESAARAIAVQAAAEAVRAMAPRETSVRVDGASPVNVGKTHRQFPALLAMAGAGVFPYLCGPSGSGKTTAAQQVAAALGLKFYFNGAIETEYKLSGFVDARGQVVSTPFRRAYTEGGVYLFDEIDGSMPSAVLAFNAALAGGSADFPGESEPVPRHPRFVGMAAANTWGMGATIEYVGRYKLDAASLDRFVMLEWDYDEDLERALATDAAWCATVQRLRAEARRRGLKVIVSPRATLAGCRLLRAGLTRDEVLDATVLARLPASERAILKAVA